MNRIKPDLNDPAFQQHCIDSANDPEQQKLYRDQLETMADNARKWKAAHPNADVAIKWGPDPKVCVIASIDTAIENKLVQVNEQGLDLLKSLWPWSDLKTTPTVSMCRAAIEHVYDPVVPSCACPYCGKVLDDATAVQGEKAKPQKGDASICINCAGLIEFGDDLKLIKMSDETWNALDAATQRIMNTAKSFIKEMRK